MNRFTKIIKAIMVSIAVVCTMGITLQARGQNGNGSHNGHEYVDLGLPSGTLWATCNVGATTPEGFGDYFAWGETRPKNYYDWSTYKWCNSEHDRTINLTKYCNYSSYGYNGFTDNLTTLQPCDDAAAANWGGDWRMPTKEDWWELFNNTTLIWNTKNGVYGMFFIASNGQSLFFPAAGCRYENEIVVVGSRGLYWSSLLDTGFTDSAWNLDFEAEKTGTWWSARQVGLSVRPVCSKH